MSEASTIRPVVLCPTYNNDGTLLEVLRGVQAQGHDLIVINDGSTDRTLELLEDFKSESDSKRSFLYSSHEINLGKAAALHSGFAVAAKAGYTHVITIDTDGQHDTASLGDLVSDMEAHPEALIIGTRSRAIKGYPGRSQVGRRFSNLAIWAECAQSVPDSQSGYRVYPLGLIDAVPCRSNRFAFESEIITRTVWGGGEVRSVPIEACYYPPETRVSHYRPWVDSFRVAGLHLILVIRALWPWPQRRRWPKIPHKDQGPVAPWYRRFLRWISPKRVLDDLKKDGVGRVSAAAGFSIGTLIANLPIYPFQSLLGLYVAKRLNMHPMPLVAGTGLSTPPFGPALIVSAIVLGHVILHGTVPTIPDIDLYNFDVRLWWDYLKSLYLEWWVGAVIIGPACMFGTFIISLFILKLLLPIQPESAAETEQSSS